MSANDGAASSSNVAAEGNFEPSANNEAASSSSVDISDSNQDAIMEMEDAAEDLDHLLTSTVLTLSSSP
ncbi:hypothetical protein Q3G72_014218 [Acer saccharum]|nr:hypothetical protein Q3G72_014218 [Acer saccharum]